MRKFNNLEGRTFGKWTVLKHLGTEKVCDYLDKRHNRTVAITRRKYLCRCKCGNEQEVLGSNLLNGLSKGCMSCRSANSPFLKEYWSEYKRLHMIKQKCYNKKHPDYKKFGAKGITICERRNSLENFIKDMGKAPAGSALIRTDSNGNYEPSNCKWITRTELRIKIGGGRKPIKDEFSALNVSNERKRQLRQNKLGMCYRCCNKKTYKAGLCKKHYIAKLDYFKNNKRTSDNLLRQTN